MHRAKSAFKVPTNEVVHHSFRVTTKGAPGYVFAKCNGTSEKLHK